MTTVLKEAYRIREDLNLHELGFIPKYELEQAALKDCQEDKVKALTKAAANRALNRFLLTIPEDPWLPARQKLISESAGKDPQANPRLTTRMRKAIHIVRDRFAPAEKQLFISQFTQGANGVAGQCGSQRWDQARMTTDRVLTGVFSSTPEVGNLRVLVQQSANQYFMQEATHYFATREGYWPENRRRFLDLVDDLEQYPTFLGRLSVQGLVARVKEAFKNQMAMQPVKFRKMLEKDEHLKKGFLTHRRAVLGQHLALSGKDVCIVHAKSIAKYLESAGLIRSAGEGMGHNSADFRELLELFAEMEEGPALIAELFRAFPIRAILETLEKERSLSDDLAALIFEAIDDDGLASLLGEAFAKINKNSPEESELKYLHRLEEEQKKRTAAKKPARSGRPRKKRRVNGSSSSSSVTPLACASKVEPKMKHVLQLAKKGNASAQLDLGSIYGSGRQVPQNSKLAEKWYRKAAGKDNISAIFELAFHVGEGPVLEKSLEAAHNGGHAFAGEARQMLRDREGLRLKAEEGDVESLWEYGKLCELGALGVTKSLKRAVHYYYLLADRGDQRGRKKIDELALSSQVRDEALAFYRKLADEGDHDALKRWKLMTNATSHTGKRKSLAL